MGMATCLNCRRFWVNRADTKRDRNSTTQERSIESLRVREASDIIGAEGAIIRQSSASKFQWKIVLWLKEGVLARQRS
jgi:hypothetical protein